MALNVILFINELASSLDKYTINSQKNSLILMKQCAFVLGVSRTRNLITQSPLQGNHQGYQCTNEEDIDHEAENCILHIHYNITVAFLPTTDKIWQERLTLKMTVAGISPLIIKLVQSFLSERTFVIKMQSRRFPPRSIHAGAFQGSVFDQFSALSTPMIFFRKITQVRFSLPTVRSCLHSAAIWNQLYEDRMRIASMSCVSTPFDQELIWYNQTTQKR